MKITKLAVVVMMLGVMLVTGVGCGGETDTGSNSIPTGFNLYTDEINGFSILYPAGWDIYTPTEEIIAWFHTEASCSEYSIGVSVDILGSEPNLSAYYTEVVKPSVSSEGYTLVSEEELILSGVPAIKHFFIISTYDTFRYSDAFLWADGKVWGIHGLCHADCWDEYGDVFNTMIDSFKFLD